MKERLLSAMDGSSDPAMKVEYAMKILQHDPPYPRILREYALSHLQGSIPDSFSNERIDNEVALVRGSLLFDAEWYLQKYASVLGLTWNKEQGDEAFIRHYCMIGWMLDFDPSTQFNTKFYLEQYPDVAKAKINPLFHYVTQGKKEGRMACPLPTSEHNPFQAAVDTQYVEKIVKRKNLYPNTSYRVVAFYLPQYHPIPENDNWWGKGFTEWTNVRPAYQLFSAHYQPHEPSELGHYIISDSSILRRQVSLAKCYGIDAFCFYFYWFNGKTLLEKPIDLFVNDSSIDHQFCLCWANENWTRRWDGMDQDVLIAQDYSHSDDQEFIQYIAKYLRDPRYLRVNGKPVLLIYRPSLLPDPVATTQVWRDWCRANGIGDLYIVYTQSFECRHPTAYGCDAGVEFAPNIPEGHQGITPELVTEQFTDLKPGFQGKVFDWMGYVQRSEHLPHPGYPIHRCINPGWDNTARKKERATVFVNSSPRSFQKWALNALKDTVSSQGDNALLFVNAWNEWAEGAHLEPDQRYGYSYLEALRMARVRLKCMQEVSSLNSAGTVSSHEIGAIVHSFYPEILNEIIHHLQCIPSLRGCHLIVTTPKEKMAECEQIIQSYRPDFLWLVIGTQNHGRDILPFFKIYDLIISLGIKVFCKLHTKKSKHRDDGDEWRKDLYSGLLDPARVDMIIEALSTDTGIGIVLPRNHILPMTEFFGSNCDQVVRLSSRVGIPICRLKDLPLVAGSMFWARCESLIPMHMLHSEEFFEPERGQVDGTYAHAMERMFSISAASLDLAVVDTDLQPFSPKTNASFSYASRG
jgi:lipopolysaccharide biosynthesis protein